MPRFSLVLITTALAVAVPALRAQTSPEDHARRILQLFESGQRDSAYAMLEPLKKSARFVPAVLFTRAEMTPDDRALPLYKEVIALQPEGEWAERSAWRLVSRYVDKRDSSASYTWNGVLKNRYPKSPYIAMADDAVGRVKVWAADDIPGQPVRDTARTRGRGSSTANGRTTPPVRRDTTVRRTSTTTRRTDTSSAGSSSAMRGYALQLGLYPTREAAQARATQMKQKGLTAAALPKRINGERQYAVIVGPYPTIEAATAKKSSVASKCGCTPFVVKVQ